EHHVEVAHALLNVADLFLALDDERVLEVDFVLRGEAGQLLLLELLLLLLAGGEEVWAGGGAAGFRVDCCARGGYRCFLLLEGLPLEVLELRKRGLEFAGEFLLHVFLCWLGLEVRMATSRN